MPRKANTGRRAWKWIIIPSLALGVLAGLQAGAEEILHLEQLARRDVEYEIVPVSLYSRCCPPCQVDCYPCHPESVTGEGGEVGEGAPGTEEPMTSPRQIAGGLAGYRGNPTLPGYIDDAFIRSRVRVRYDDMQNANFPTRANFWYPTLGVFGGPGPAGEGVVGVPGVGQAGAGSSANVDLKELTTYVEAAFCPTFSVFGEFPIRWVDSVSFGPTTPENIFNDGVQGGAGDIRAGLRYGLIACPDEALTLQVRAWAPTGNARQALGVGHPSVDAGLLYSARTSQCCQFFAEINDWQTIDAGRAVTPDTAPNFAEADLNANILRYGAGVGYDLWQSNCCRPKTLTALFEIVGWTVLEGVTTPTSFDPNSTDPVLFKDAEGDTIINGKYGVRYTWSCTGCGSETVYVGYGHNWTQDRWYSDILRLEVTHFF